ncbi:MAG: hypothetical protein QM627_10260 [Luteolibacter sp.]
MKTIRLFLLAITPLFFLSCEKGATASTAGDVTFAKNTFESLVRGDSAVTEKIDWPVLTALGNNVGTQYNNLPTDLDKEKFRTSFVTQFATSFREGGGNIDKFTNWRVTFHDKTRTEVAADSPNGALVLTVSGRDGKERISAFNLVK